jgi:hypothetical protein
LLFANTTPDQGKAVPAQAPIVNKITTVGDRRIMDWMRSRRA